MQGGRKNVIREKAVCKEGGRRMMAAVQGMKEIRE